jgi:hypothetical protein
MDEFYELKNRKVKKRKTNTNGEKVVENQFQHVLIDILIAQLTQSTGKGNHFLIIFFSLNDKVT